VRRPLALVGDVLTSRWFWTMRIATTGISLYMIWSVTIMTDYIAMTPTEFLPALLIVGVVTALVFTYIRAVPAYNDMNKEKLRAGTITEKIKYGMDYLISDVISFVGAISLGVVVPGVIYNQYLHADPELAGCLIMTFVVAMIVAYGGVAVIGKVLDAFHDKAKISKLEGKTE